MRKGTHLLVVCMNRDPSSSIIQIYDIPVGCPPGITSPRDDCDNPLEGKLFLVDTPQGCHICFIIPNKIQNTKGRKNTNTRDFGGYSSSALLN